MKIAVLKAGSNSFRYFDRSFQLLKGLKTSKKLSRVGELSPVEGLQGR